MIKGKVINVDGDNLLVSLGYLLKDTHGRYVLKDKKYGLLSRCCLTRRFFRAEITGFYTLSNGIQLAIAKKGVFRRSASGKTFVKICSIPRGSKPLTIVEKTSDEIFFGEYFQNVEKVPVHIYSLDVNTGELKVVYTFDQGEINHIHGLFRDSYTNRIWVVTGDDDGECIIGYTEDNFAHFIEVYRGGQEYRCCQMFFYPEFIVYATDSQFIPNTIKRIDRKTLDITPLKAVQGSVIKGGQAGNVSFLSTTVEPSLVNKDQYAHLWITKDGMHWEERYKAKKDWMPAIMQFGTFEFPHYEKEPKDRIYFSGRAVESLDGNSTFIEL
ncbi:MAG: hypothetical protein J6W18_00110 [Bacteroidaceae bacterium]|nr:hypothetical protein [Bacteroidaceae bacterium]